MKFDVYGRWEHGSPISTEQLARVEENLPLGRSAHVWIERKDAKCLGLYLEVEAASYDEAIELGRVALEETASGAPLPGHAVEISSSTDEGQSVWPENLANPGASRW